MPWDDVSHLLHAVIVAELVLVLLALKRWGP
jgi:hypothetical protein